MMFNSDENNWEIWKTNLNISHPRLLQLHKYVLNRNDEQLFGPVAAAVGANAAAIAVI